MPMHGEGVIGSKMNIEWLLQEIERLRQELNSMIGSAPESFNEPQVREISTKLDALILEYTKESMNLNLNRSQHAAESVEIYK